MTGDRTSTENAVGIREADEPKPLPAVAIDRLRDDLRTRNLYREDELFVLKVREDDLRSLITAYESKADENARLRGALEKIARRSSIVFRGRGDMSANEAFDIARSALTQSPPATENGE